MTISVVFDPPLPTDTPAEFNVKAFALVGDLNTWSTQANALPGEVATNLSALLASGTVPGSFTTLSAATTVTLNNAGAYSIKDVAGAVRAVLGLSSGDELILQNTSGDDGGPIYINSKPAGGNTITCAADGAVTIPGAVHEGTIAAITTATYAATSSTRHLVANYAGTVTLTLPSASPAGRVINVKTVLNQAVVSASANVYPLNSGTLGTAILAATAGRWAMLVSDGTHWSTMAGN